MEFENKLFAGYMLAATAGLTGIIYHDLQKPETAEIEPVKKSYVCQDETIPDQRIELREEGNGEYWITIQKDKPRYEQMSSRGQELLAQYNSSSVLSMRGLGDDFGVRLTYDKKDNSLDSFSSFEKLSEIRQQILSGDLECIVE